MKEERLFGIIHFVLETDIQQAQYDLQVHPLYLV